jgi:hypothetical protein
MNESFTANYLDDVRTTFRAYKELADKALAQLNDEELFVTLDEEGNSIAVIMKHLAGNMLSRFTDFLTSDGEKPDRDRDAEFVVDPQTSKADLFGYWERGWNAVFTAVDPLQPEDLDMKVFIRSEAHTVVQAINRQLTHYAYHIGQLVFLAKHFRAREWTSLSVPRNQSAGFNEYLKKKIEAGEQEHRFDAAAGFVKESGKEN